MSRKLFYSIAAFIIIILAGIFSFKLLSMAQHDCEPYFNFECDAQGQLACEGEIMSPYNVLSRCVGGDCWGRWEFWCDEGTEYVIEGPVTCIDYENPGCSHMEPI
jgi:hypothetical protein